MLALAAKQGVSDVRVFGSVARGEQGPDSDLDLLVHLPEDAGLVLGRFGDELHKLLGAPVVVPDPTSGDINLAIDTLRSPRQATTRSPTQYSRPRRAFGKHTCTRSRLAWHGRFCAVNC